MHRFHHSDFSDIDALVRLKKETGQRISVCIPTRNEERTIGEIVSMIQRELCDRFGLVDEILVIDSDSSDLTRTVAKAAGARVYQSAEIAPEYGGFLGKGENLWKALKVSVGDLVCYVDGDIRNFHLGFLLGLIGPILSSPEIDYVKAFYQRPFLVDGMAQAHGGGRVSEILVKPLLSLFYPCLCEVIQPLSGEYAARRSLLNRLAFPTGYGVEVAHLIDLFQMGAWERLAQCDLDRREHHHRSDVELGDTAFAILQVIFRRLKRDGKVSVDGDLSVLHQRWLDGDQGLSWTAREIPEIERPAWSYLESGETQE